MWDRSSLLIFLVMLGACTGANRQSKNTMLSYARDPHSFSQPQETTVEHLHLDLEVDFDSKTLTGKAGWKLKQPHGTIVVFDTDGLEIISAAVDGQSASFTLGEYDVLLGRALTISIPRVAGEVVISYQTQPDAKALQWLTPEQTLGKKDPFLFSQSQAILARSWIPCQDGPGIRFTYSATLHVPHGLMALMSAANPRDVDPRGIYQFKMEQPIPSYLMALSLGNLAFRSIGPRTGVYAEPALADAVAWEFADIEKMMKATEGLYGPYAWGRFDILVLPPSFPFGGMENPRLTFATPTILTGDRSLVSLIAHELAHSWSGNLVTNATWNDFWLNEGFTVYSEQRIMEALYGREYSEMLAQLSYDGLVKEIEEFSKTGRIADTHLKLDLKGRNPDDGMNTIAYDKGYLFLRTLEESVGRGRWDEFLRDYFAAFEFKSMDTERFLALLREKLLNGGEDVTVPLEAWIFGPGIPKGAAIPRSTRFSAVDNIREAFQADPNGALPDSETTAKWSTHEWLHFISGLKDPTLRQLQTLDWAYGFTESHNAEIFAAWMQPTLRCMDGSPAENLLAMGIKTAYSTGGETDFHKKVEDFLVRVGRRKFLTPTYKAMLETGQKEWGLHIYNKARPGYHAVVRETIDKLFK